MRKFELKDAKRERVQLLLGLIGPSGGGKTYSALRLATGIRAITGGDIHFIDTESRRALHYADKFDFKHMDLGAPFGPEDYLAALQHCAKNGATTIIVDSMSLEHEGPGGILEMHEAELQRMAGDDYQKRARVQGFAWGPPKRAHRRLINGILQLGSVNLILCFRAKQKLDWKNKTKKGEPREMGWMPICGDDLVYELTLRALLPPGADGVARWEAELPGEREATIKLPEQFRELCSKPRRFDEEMGREMAQWSMGAGAAAASDPTPRFSGKLEWDGLSEWGGKPLSKAPLGALEAYRVAVDTAKSDAKPQQATRLQVAIKDIDDAIGAIMDQQQGGS